ncbi:hypothetical protein [Rhodoferax sp. GW822-FHT02A01]|uniref:hypothetical protein n=1 Tax=Rhodoferax sp. GW822-FHT02A01 TaxID=3141537 RepID=UPI00315CBD73
MDLKTALLLLKRYASNTLLVLLIFGGGMAYFAKELLVQKEKLAADQMQLASERVTYEKYRADISIALKERLYEIEKREFIVQQLDSQSKEQSANLQKRSATYEADFNHLRQAQEAVSTSQRMKTAEEQLQKLMHEFSDLGMSLNASIPCDDAEAQRKFTTAKSKFYEALAVAEANGLTKRYDQFFFHNGQMVQHACYK